MVAYPGSSYIKDDNIEDVARFSISKVSKELRDTIGDDKLIQVITSGHGDRRIPDVAIYGDISAILAKAHGFTGALLDGATRDRKQLAQLGGFSVMHRGTHPQDAFGLWHISHIHTDPSTQHMHCEEIAGVKIKALDYIHMDVDGFCVIPAALADQVPALAKKRFEKEEKMRVLLASREDPKRVHKTVGKW